MRRLLAIFGTDTGVGKTIVTAAIAAAALSRGESVRVLKPVQTGFPPDDDAAEVNRLVGQDIACRGTTLAAALGPAVAARQEGRELRPGDLEQMVREVASKDGLALVETAGGVAVEIAPGYDMAALAAATGAVAVLVCRPSLGTLNHTLLSTRHLRQAGVEVAGLVISGFPADPGQPELTNPPELERLVGAALLGVLPWLPELEVRELARAARGGLAPALGGEFDRGRWLEALGWGAAPFRQL